MKYKKIAISIIFALLLADISYTAFKFLSGRYALSLIPGWHIQVVSPYHFLELVFIGLIYLFCMAYLISRLVRSNTNNRSIDAKVK
ncbi:MAG TPA: hypothetical protein VL947_07965 [Cytophagales bacterium]|nr:hypothetical protein [Cytophagales bacterium]